MGNDIHIHLDEIPPEVADTLARGCLRLYYQIIAMPNGRELLDDAGKNISSGRTLKPHPHPLTAVPNNLHPAGRGVTH